MTEGLIQIADLGLFKRYAQTERVKKPHLSERALAIKYFVETFKLNPKRLAPKLAHIETRDLYPLQSQVKDRLQRQNKETARKWFYWSIRTIPSDQLQKSENNV